MQEEFERGLGSSVWKIFQKAPVRAVIKGKPAVGWWMRVGRRAFFVEAYKVRANLENLRKAWEKKYKLTVKKPLRKKVLKSALKLLMQKRKTYIIPVAFPIVIKKEPDGQPNTKN